MSRWLVALGVAVVVVAGLVVYLVGFPRPVGPTGDPGADQGGGPVAPRRAEAAPPPPPGAPLPPAAAGGAPLIVIADARFAPVFKQDVPSQRDGQLMFIGVELR
ncbi:MAG TPA: hypothetical protein VFA26_19230, partial [Gemmataceae bacterium]|nr:hypothetical protein [Gemmataceae bacterium]